MTNGTRIRCRHNALSMGDSLDLYSLSACSYEAAPQRRNAVARGAIQADQFATNAMAHTSPRIRSIRDVR